MIYAINKKFKEIPTNVRVQFILYFLIGFILIGGVFNSFVNLLLLEEGLSKSYIGTFNGFGLIGVSLGALINIFLCSVMQKKKYL